MDCTVALSLLLRQHYVRLYTVALITIINDITAQTPNSDIICELNSIWLAFKLLDGNDARYILRGEYLKTQGERFITHEQIRYYFYLFLSFSARFVIFYLTGIDLIVALF